VAVSLDVTQNDTTNFAKVRVQLMMPPHLQLLYFLGKKICWCRA